MARCLRAAALPPAPRRRSSGGRVPRVTSSNSMIFGVPIAKCPGDSDTAAADRPNSRIGYSFYLVRQTDTISEELPAARASALARRANTFHPHRGGKRCSAGTVSCAGTRLCSSGKTMPIRARAPRPRAQSHDSRQGAAGRPGPGFRYDTRSGSPVDGDCPAVFELPRGRLMQRSSCRSWPRRPLGPMTTTTSPGGGRRAIRRAIPRTAPKRFTQGP